MKTKNATGCNIQSDTKLDQEWDWELWNETKKVKWKKGRPMRWPEKIKMFFVRKNARKTEPGSCPVFGIYCNTLTHDHRNKKLSINSAILSLSSLIQYTPYRSAHNSTQLSYWLTFRTTCNKGKFYLTPRACGQMIVYFVLFLFSLFGTGPSPWESSEGNFPIMSCSNDIFFVRTIQVHIFYKNLGLERPKN